MLSLEGIPPGGGGVVGPNTQTGVSFTSPMVMGLSGVKS